MRAVRLLFLFFIAYLPLQYGAVGIIGLHASEPWPALVLPGFKNIYSTGDRIEILEPRFYAQWGREYKQKQRIPTEELFEGIHPSQLQGFVRTHFQDPDRISGLGNEAREWLGERIEVVYPVATQSVELEVAWVRVTYSQTGTGVEIDHEEVVRIVTIPLEGDDD